MTTDALRVRRLRRAAALVGAGGALLLLLATGAQAQDPSPSPGASPAASAEPEASLIPGPPAPTPIAHPSDGSSNQCYDCHVAVNDRQAKISTAWQESIHGKGGIGCADCHGGDPTSDRMGIAMDRTQGFIGTPSRDETVGICGSCHSDPSIMGQYNLPTDQYDAYWTSVHGQRLLEADDTRVAICIDCHGSHDVKKASDPTAAVYPLNVPALCSSCHADAGLMEPYGIPTDQFAQYSLSVHGVALLDEDDVRAPSCASCHGSHGAKPPRSSEVVDVCGKCHTATQDLYLESRHAELEQTAPKCWTCHGTHDVEQPSNALFFHPEPPDYLCTTCHDLQNQSLRLQVEQFEDPADRRCDTCHHPNSDIYAQVEAIYGSLEGAETAHDEAEAKIDEAASVGMIVNDAEVKLSEAKTSLIQAQAAVHTTKLTLISDTAAEAEVGADEAAALAQAKLDESVFRREAMVVVIVLIVVNIAILLLVKRWLDRDLERADPPDTS